MTIQDRGVAFFRFRVFFLENHLIQGGENLQWITEKNGEWYKILASRGRMKTRLT